MLRSRLYNHLLRLLLFSAGVVQFSAALFDQIMPPSWLQVFYLVFNEYLGQYFLFKKNTSELWAWLINYTKVCHKVSVQRRKSWFCVIDARLFSTSDTHCSTTNRPITRPLPPPAQPTACSATCIRTCLQVMKLVIWIAIEFDYRYWPGLIGFPESESGNAIPYNFASLLCKFHEGCQLACSHMYFRTLADMMITQHLYRM